MHTTTCSCDYEMAVLNATLQHQVKRGCEMMKNFPDFYASELDALLKETVNNFFKINGKSEIQKNILQLYSRNYSYLIAKRGFIQKLNECFEIWTETSDELLKLKCEFCGLFKNVMNGLFPNHFRLSKSDLFQNDLALQYRLKEVEKNISSL